MAISCASLFDDVVAEIGSGVATSRLTNAFVRAVNRTLAELAHRTRSATWTTVTSTTDSITIDEEYEYVVYAGIIKNMIRMGFRPGDPKIATLAYQDSMRNWNDAIGNYQANEVNTDADNTDSHIARLGSVTTTDT